MAIKLQEKSYKDYFCSKCGNLIKEGTAYYRAEIRGVGPIIRCTLCGIKPYEDTASPYKREIGELIARWPELYTIDYEGVGAIIEDLDYIFDDQSKLIDRAPKSFTQFAIYPIIVERMNGIKESIKKLNEIRPVKETDYYEQIREALLCLVED